MNSTTTGGQGLTINVEALLQLCQKGGGVLSLHLVHAQLLLQVQHKAAQEGHKVLSSPDVSRHLLCQVASAMSLKAFLLGVVLPTDRSTCKASLGFTGRDHS